MHTIHHTPAVILRSEPRGEYDKTYWLFTKDFGLVRAVATGVRKQGAKLRGQLVDYAFVDVDLVKGKEVWRLVSATQLFNPIRSSTSPLARPYVRTLGTLSRFLIDEGEHGVLFAHIQEVARAVYEETVELKVFDALAIWRTLVHLGYIDGAIEASFVDAAKLLDEHEVKAMVISVNETIKETHL
jgi:recombinational DNA repair protein (RecF pathway)